jgi:hypothetical protein
MSLYCYKTDIPEHRLSELFRLYAVGAQDQAIQAIEGELLREAILLKECDAAVFSFDNKEGVPVRYGTPGELPGPALLPLDTWKGTEPPRRVRIDMRRGEELLWLEQALPREHFQPRVATAVVPERVRAEEEDAQE